MGLITCRFIRKKVEDAYRESLHRLKDDALAYRELCERFKDGIRAK